MVQKRKEHVRRAILDAAVRELATTGFPGMTLNRVAARADTSIGNLYRYFSSKEELFQAAVPPAVAEEFKALVKQRVEALGAEHGIAGLEPVHPYRAASEELFGFALGHRWALVFLLQRAQGTVYASFAEDLSEVLTRLALDYVRRAYPETRVPPGARRVLRRIYRGLVSSLASSLHEESTGSALRGATNMFGVYHLTGLRALFESMRMARSTRQS